MEAVSHKHAVHLCCCLISELLGFSKLLNLYHKHLFTLLENSNATNASSILFPND